MNDICEALAETICSRNIVGPTPEQVSRLAAEIKRAINDWLEKEVQQ